MGAGSDTPAMTNDFHVHSDYSDGKSMVTMVEAARDAGLDGVGFADHCNVSAEEPGVSRSFDLDETYAERRREIESLREEFDVEIFDAVEMDYRPADEDRIEAFFADADFEYALGSVHHVGERNVVAPWEFDDDSETERAAFVDEYFAAVVDCVESELFDVLAHVDLVERNEVLRGHATADQYRAVAKALSDSRTVPELNAGRVLDDYGELHPHPEFLEILREANVSFAVGTDAHTPTELIDRVEYLSNVVESLDVDIVDVR